MDIFNLISLAGGVAVFLYGMHLMGEGLQAVASDNLEKILARLTNNLLKAVLLGMLVTAIIQSSSATTVMVVGLVNSGIMQLSQAVGVIMGANIGTTMTSWLLSLTGIQGDSFLLRLANPSGFAPILAVVGICLIMLSKRDKQISLGEVIFGFAILMLGMEAMSSALAPLETSPRFRELFLLFENPLLGVLAGAVLTAIVQSSSASIGILQALAASGQVTWVSAIPIILGQNIGTCVTAMLSSLGAKNNAKRAAVIHLLFNTIGTLVFMAVFYSLNAFLDFSFLDKGISLSGIALFHSIFNVSVTILLLPFHKLLLRLSIRLVKEDKIGKSQQEAVLDSGKNELLEKLDPRFLETPAFALSQAKSALKSMAALSEGNLRLACSMLQGADEEKLAQVIKRENLADSFEDELQTYLMKISQRQITDEDSIVLNIMLHSINDFERISDHCVHIAEALCQEAQAEDNFSQAARQELQIYMSAVVEIVSLACSYLRQPEDDLSSEIEALEEVIDNLKVELSDRHIRRLQGNACTMSLGFAFNDLLTALERVADHAANISFYIKDLAKGSYDRHRYKVDLRESSENFERYFNTYKLKYRLSDQESLTA